MKSYLLSQLVFRFGSQDLKAFQTAHPHDWLLWEPGTWKPPSSSTVMLLEPVSDAPKKKAPSGEALALAMLPNVQGGFTVGRGNECDAPINDGTLSQLHLVFLRSPKGDWTVRDAGSKNGSWVDGHKLQQGKPVGLRDGTRIMAAQVAFSFYTPAAMLKRIKQP